MEKLISEFSLGLFFWQTVIFIGLIFLLKKYAWKPILSAVNERETSIKDALKEAKEARSEMESLKSDNQRILKEARTEKEALLKEARIVRSEIINRAKEEAKTEANNILSQAQEAIKNEKRLAINELKSQVSSLALDIAEKVLQNELESKDKQIELVDNLLKNSDLK
ncbi:MAG: ATP synthase F0 subunit B [Flavobacteriaceae bacterium TMED179]|nr:MAG: ATP synthase F0 subunit B [Flavobacteriaceae bacterium TMED179]|tara:strand:+ start:131 stop:631 length:501 start_codon:yes stop_codon:yes gene_type:complete